MSLELCLHWTSKANICACIRFVAIVWEHSVGTALVWMHSILSRKSRRRCKDSRASSLSVNWASTLNTKNGLTILYSSWDQWWRRRPSWWVVMNSSKFALEQIRNSVSVVPTECIEIRHSLFPLLKISCLL